MTTSASNSKPGSKPQATAQTLPVSRAIVSAALVVGVLDATDGVVFLGLHGKTPIQVLQYIASSLLGAQSFSGGLASAGLGLVLHFATATVVATIYILASRRLTVLRTQWAVLGLIWSDRVNLCDLWVCFCRCFSRCSRTERAAVGAVFSDD
jgi:hypothetical protein